MLSRSKESPKRPEVAQEKGSCRSDGVRGGSTDRSGLWVSTPIGQVGSPVVHEPTSALEQVGAPIGRLGRVPVA